MEIREFSFNQRRALGVSGQEIHIYSEPSGPNQGGQIFRSDSGDRAIILTSDQGWWWKRNCIEADYCFYAQYWMGEFPYSSFAWCVRQCKTTGIIKTWTIETEINPSGMTDSDLFIQNCRTYVPQQLRAAHP